MSKQTKFNWALGCHGHSSQMAFSNPSTSPDSNPKSDNRLISWSTPWMKPRKEKSRRPVSDVAQKWKLLTHWLISMPSLRYINLTLTSNLVSFRPRVAYKRYYMMNSYLVICDWVYGVRHFACATPALIENICLLLTNGDTLPLPHISIPSHTHHMVPSATP